MSISYFPSQIIPTKDKNDKWKSQHLDYAESLLKYYSPVKDRMTRLYESYNGVKPPQSLAWLEKTYGKQNRSRYIAYRLGRTKIDLLNGEWLKRPLAATVTTINSDAMSEKLQQEYFMRGAMVAKEEIVQIKQKGGVDIMEGTPIPEDENDPIWDKMSFKDQCEDVMQIILNNQIKELNIKKKLSRSFLDLEITNHCFVKVERDETGEIKLYNIDPRDAIYEAIEGDDYLERSPIMGAGQWVPIHQVLKRYNLTPKQVQELENARDNPDSYLGESGTGRGYMQMSNGQLMCYVIHVTWISSTPDYYKIVPKTKSQLELDGSSDKLEFQMDPVKYETNIDYHNKNVEKGLYKVEVRYRDEEYEATRIGGCIDVNMRPTRFQKRSIDKPSEVLNSTYLGYIHGRVDGVSVSLQQVIENFDNMFDINMYQILKDLSRMKGKVLTIDRSAIGQKVKLEEVLYNMMNNQLIDYDSSAIGNAGGRNLDPSTMFKTFDLGLSDSFQQLLVLQNNIINMLNQITGINETRAGQTAASSTATAQQSDISNSRTITEGLFYGMHGFVERVMKTVVNSTAVSWAFYKTEKGEQILGTDRFQFLKVTEAIGYRDYGVYIEDGTEYLEISQKIEQMMLASLNAKEIRTMDALNVLLAKTVAQKKSFLENAWVEMQKVMQASQENAQQAEAAMQQQSLETQVQIATENREDQQKAKMDEIYAKGEVQIEVDKQKAMNDARLIHVQSQSDLINDQDDSIIIQ